jgi:hypothetical protein
MGDIRYDILSENNDPEEQLIEIKKLLGVITKTRADMKKYQDKYALTLSCEDANIYLSIKDRNKRMKNKLKERIKTLYNDLYKGA